MFQYECLELVEVYGHDASMSCARKGFSKRDSRSPSAMQARAYVATKSSNNRRAVDATPIQRNISSLMRSSENAYCVDATINSRIFLIDFHRLQRVIRWTILVAGSRADVVRSREVIRAQ